MENTINPSGDILAEIETFVSNHGMAESTFGRKAAGDWRLIAQLRTGRELRRRTIAKLRDFMASHK